MDEFFDNADLYTDYDDFIYGLFDVACGVGMPISEFWEAEPSDTLVYIDSMRRQKQIDQYNLSVLTAQMFGVTLSNAFRKKGQQAEEYPALSDIFDMPDITEDKPKEEYDPQAALMQRAFDLEKRFGGRKR